MKIKWPEMYVALTKETKQRNRIQSLQDKLDRTSKMFDKVLEKQEREIATTNNKHKITILGDSNTKNIGKHLNKNENLQLTAIMTYTTEELLNYSTTQMETITKAQHIFIHTGTNDLKKGEPAVEVFNRMEQATTNIRKRTNAQITIIKCILRDSSKKWWNCPYIIFIYCDKLGSLGFICLCCLITGSYMMEPVT